MNWMFKLRGGLTGIQQIVLGLSGILLFLLIWIALSSGSDPLVKSGILPHPWRVLTAYSDLLRDNELIRNICYSIGLNLAGYVKAIALSLFFGFMIGLFPFFRGMLQNHVNAIRFIPLTAVTSLFIVWFGIGTNMKVNFLAFGIMIYLLPVVVQRIDEVSDVYTFEEHLSPELEERAPVIAEDIIRELIWIQSGVITKDQVDIEH